MNDSIRPSPSRLVPADLSVNGNWQHSTDYGARTLALHPASFAVQLTHLLPSMPWLLVVSCAWLKADAPPPIAWIDDMIINQPPQPRHLCNRKLSGCYKYDSHHMHPVSICPNVTMRIAGSLRMRTASEPWFWYCARRQHPPLTSN